MASAKLLETKFPTIIITLNFFILGEKRKIFCQFNPCHKFCKEFKNDDETWKNFNSFCIKQLSSLRVNTENSQLITKKWVKDEQGHTREVWGCSPANYHLFVSLSCLPTFSSKVKLELLPKNVKYAMTIHEEMYLDTNEMDKMIVPRITEPIWKTLRPFQQTCVRYAVARDGRVLIADDMGLGKTRESLAIAAYYKAWPLLIVTLANCRPAWKNEVIDFLHLSPDSIEIIKEGAALRSPLPPGGKPPTPPKKLGGKKRKMDKNDEDKNDDKKTIISSSFSSSSSSPSSLSPIDLKPGGERGGAAPPTITVISYALLTTKLDILKKRGYKMIIVDESQKTKNHDSKCSKAVVDITKETKYALYLSGTPLVKPKEIYPTMFALYPKIFPDFCAFAERYCDPKQVDINVGGKGTSYTRKIQKFDGRENSNELHIVLSTLMMIRRMKDEKGVDINLPTKHRTFFLLNPDKKQVKLVDKHMSKIDTTKMIAKIAEIKSRDDSDSVDDNEENTEEQIKIDFGKDNAFMSAYRKIAKIKLPLIQSYIRGSCAPPLTPLLLDSVEKKVTEKKVMEKIEKKKVAEKKTTKKRKVESSSDSSSSDSSDDEEVIKNKKKQKKQKISETNSSSTKQLQLSTPNSTLEETKETKSTPTLETNETKIISTLQENETRPTVTLETKEIKKVEKEIKQGGERGGAAPPNKMIMFGHHMVVLDGIEIVLQEQGIKYVRMDGKTDKKLTGQIVDTFQNDPECQVALLSMTSAGTGLTLTAATVVIFLEMHPSAEVVLQAECRAHRIGQTREVECIYLAFPGSIEEILWQLINKKFKALTSIVDGRLQHFSANRVTQT
jgi:SNF2 family DNA or RNA helicase